MTSKPIKVFYSYSRRDEHLRAELAKHLSPLRHQGVIEDWHDREIDAGDDWEEVIRLRLSESDLVLLLISPDFLASEYCYGKELAYAMERHVSGETEIVPILLRPIDWESTPFSSLKPLPRNRKPIISWENTDDAFTDVAKQLRRIIKHHKKEQYGSFFSLSHIYSLFNNKQGKLFQAESLTSAKDVTGYLRIPLECQSCGQKYYTTAFQAGSKYRCRKCGCEEAIPDEHNLMILAIRHQKITHEILEKVYTGRLFSENIFLQAPLLLREIIDPNDPIKVLQEEDIVERCLDVDVENIPNVAFIARQKGLLTQIEADLDKAIAGTLPKNITPNLLSVGVTHENMRETVDAMVKTYINIATDERVESDEPDHQADKYKVTRPDITSIKPFRRSRILCLSCDLDKPYGKALSNHLTALVSGDKICSVVTRYVDNISIDESSVFNIISPYHFVILLMSTDMLATNFCKQRAIEKLLEYHNKHDIVLLPVITRPMAWQKLKISKLQVLPPDGGSLSAYSVLDDACSGVVEGIYNAICKLKPEIIVKVAERSDVEAMNDLWVSFSLGEGVKYNPEKMLEWLEKSARKGKQPYVMSLLGIALQERRPEEAISWMLQAAEEGYDVAMWQLAKWYESGICVQMNKEQAFFWMQKSADSGYLPAMYEVARMFFNGFGVNAEQSKGTQWLRRAAEKGFPLAMVNLGNSYNLGRGVSQDFSLAEQWWRRAVATGDKEALQVLRRQGYIQ